MKTNVVIQPTMLAEIAANLADCPWGGGRTALMVKFAKQVGLTASTLYRHLKKNSLIDGGAKNRAPIRPEYRSWVAIAKQLAMKTPKDAPPVPLWLAIRQAVADHLIPPEALQVHINSLHRVAREMGLQELPKRTRQLHHDHPMGVIQFDASTSERFSVVEMTSDGDFILRLHTRPYSEYKNKPLINKLGLRCIVYALWDMHSGYSLSRYTVAKGEDGWDGIDFLIWAMLPKDDPRIPFQGAPESLWMDQGPTSKLKESVDLLNRLEIPIVTGEPYEKTRMGGVERTHRTRWNNLEATFFLRYRKGEKFEILLSELNRALWDFLAEVANERPARFNQGLTRRQAWLQGVARMGGVRSIPEGAMATLTTCFRRTVNAGVFVFNHQTYEIDLGLGNVHVFCDMEGTPRNAKCILTGADYAVTYRGPVMVGQEFRGIAETPAQKLKKRAHDIIGQTRIFGNDDTEPSNIIQLPPRTVPARPLLNPQVPDTSFASLDDAMLFFSSLYTLPLTPDVRGFIRDYIQSTGMNRDTVRKFTANLLDAAKSTQDPANSNERIAL